jgi:hypothetical protein
MHGIVHAKRKEAPAQRQLSGGEAETLRSPPWFKTGGFPYEDTASVVFLSERSDHAWVVYEALTGSRMPPPPDPEPDEEYGHIEVAEPAQAALLLREHAGAAGLLAADYIKDEILAGEWCSVGMLRDYLSFTVWKHGGPVAGGSVTTTRPAHPSRLRASCSRTPLITQ